MHKIATQLAEDVLKKILKESTCDTPGKKIRSKGKGRGRGVGKGKGPIGAVRGSEKKATQIATEVFEKLAISRWREAIYSGELPQAQAENLKKVMGVTPTKEMAGLERGARGIAKAQGYTTHEYTLGKAWDALKKGRITKDKLIEAVPRAAMSIGLGGAMTNPAAKEIVHVPEFTKAMFGRMIPRGDRNLETLRGVGSLIKGHEASEAMAMGSKGLKTPYIVPVTGAKERAVKAGVGMSIPLKAIDLAKRIGIDLPTMKPEELAPQLARSPASGLVGGLHADPGVILREVRQSRMLSPGVQQTIENVRNMSGEFPALRASTGDPTGTPVIPKRQMKHIADKMRYIADNQIDSISKEMVRSAKKPFSVRGLVRKGIGGLLRRGR